MFLGFYSPLTAQNSSYHHRSIAKGDIHLAFYLPSFSQSTALQSLLPALIIFAPLTSVGMSTEKRKRKRNVPKKAEKDMKEDILSVVKTWISFVVPQRKQKTGSVFFVVVFNL